MPPILVFSHLRWDFVFQRPQQLMVRLAKHHPVYFIEEPVFTEGRSYNVHYSPAPGVCVIKPHTAVKAPGFHDDQIAHLQPLLAGFFAPIDIENCLLWLYTPMALPLIAQFQPGLIVYDCMDELRAFKNAPPQLYQRENALLELADVVFTGGPSLYEARRNLHPNVHCFPSSVDAEHFAQALDAELDHPEQRAIARPRLGFFGVIDERFDRDLLAAVASAHPEWQLCMVGPIVKIDPASLPQRDNIFYFGQRDYAELPQFVAGWDVCLLPFARNEATRYISPTKTLEYMAAGKPVVAIALHDVVKLYGQHIYLAETHAQFIGACEAVLALTPAARAELREDMQQAVMSTSWDLTVEQMLPLLQPLPQRHANAQILLQSPQRNSLNAAAASLNGSAKNATASRAVENFDCIVLGAGPTGLSAAYHLGESTLLLERDAQVGGNCRSIEDGGFTFDYAGHIMFSNDPYVQQLYTTLLGDNVHWQDREAWIYSNNVFTRYPFQGALYGLPPKVSTECVMGAIEARFGVSDDPAKLAQLRAVAEPKNFEEFIYRSWGAGVAKHFAIPYNQKLWTVPLTDIETSWMKGRVPLPNLEEMIAGALEPVPKPVGPNARFGYPLRGGFQALMEAFVPHLQGTLALNSKVVGLSPARREVRLEDGKVYSYGSIIATLPLPELIKIIGDEAPPAVRQAAQQLQFVSVRCVNIGVGRERVTDKHWIYYPEDTIFHRIFVQGNASPQCNAAGGFGLTCEITYSAHKPLPYSGEALIRRCIDDCIKVGMIAADDPIWVANEADIPYAYVVYDHARANNVKIIKSWLSERDIIAAGRYAEWEYYNSDHAFIAGKNAAQAARELAGAAAPAVAATSTTAAATSVSSTALSSAVLSSSGLTGDNRGGGRSGARAAKLGV